MKISLLNLPTIRANWNKHKDEIIPALKENKITSLSREEIDRCFPDSPLLARYTRDAAKVGLIPFPFLPDSLSLHVAGKWIEGHTEHSYKNPTIHFKIRLVNNGKEMPVDYSGGILAFASYAAREKFSAVNKQVRVVADEYVYNEAVRGLFEDAKLSLQTVIHSLLSDSRAGEMSFTDFCSDFGYDTDSRKALAVWEACVETNGKFRALVGREMFDELETLLSDY